MQDMGANSRRSAERSTPRAAERCSGAVGPMAAESLGGESWASNGLLPISVRGSSGGLFQRVLLLPMFDEGCDLGSGLKTGADGL